MSNIESSDSFMAITVKKCIIILQYDPKSIRPKKRVQQTLMSFKNMKQSYMPEPNFFQWLGGCFSRQDDQKPSEIEVNWLKKAVYLRTEDQSFRIIDFRSMFDTTQLLKIAQLFMLENYKWRQFTFQSSMIETKIDRKIIVKIEDAQYIIFLKPQFMDLEQIKAEPTNYDDIYSQLDNQSVYLNDTKYTAQFQQDTNGSKHQQMFSSSTMREGNRKQQIQDSSRNIIAGSVQPASNLRYSQVSSSLSKISQTLIMTTSTSRNQFQNNTLNQSKQPAKESRVYTGNSSIETGTRTKITATPSIMNPQSGKTGIMNIGNTCFINASLQCLAQNPDLVNALLQQSNKGPVATELLKIFVGLWAGKVVKNDIQGFVMSFKKQAQQFGAGKQQDSCEFLSCLLNILHEEVNIGKKSKINAQFSHISDSNAAAEQHWKQYTLRNQSMIVDLFQGQIEKLIRCSICNCQLNTYSEFMILQMPLILQREGGLSPRIAMNIIDCFEFLQSADAVVDVWRCDTCQKRNTPRIDTQLCFLPKYLILGISKYRQDIRGNRTKFDGMIDFPLWNLNLRKYVKSASISTNYNLLGVINHYGTLESGHYTSYVKHHFENEFYLYDDSRVRLVLDKKEIVTKNAYVLFYERI